MGRDFRLVAAAVRRALTRNTALVVASAPCFPHGVIDDVVGIAQARGFSAPVAPLTSPGSFHAQVHVQVGLACAQLGLLQGCCVA